jgi:ABC-type transporter Mla maintaining outer membrane lipid asymmetry ATPase subunit MlaF
VFVHQDPALLDTLDVRENIAFAVERAGIPASEVGARVHDTIARLGLESVRGRAPHALPVAVQKRVALARALCMNPGVLVVDEPTTGLDPSAAAAVDDALASVDKGGACTLIVITHSPRTLQRLAPDVVVVEEGRARPATRRAA